MVIISDVHPASNREAKREADIPNFDTEWRYCTASRVRSSVSCLETSDTPLDYWRRDLRVLVVTS